jgi:hypothetical protein
VTSVALGARRRDGFVAIGVGNPASAQFRPPAQARRVELPAAGGAGPHLCLGGREGRRGHARQSAPGRELALVRGA